jgi:putative mRNA 3-end processing factor
MPLTPGDPIQLTDRGLYVSLAGVHIDPWQPVERALITHAHADHFARGCGSYVASVTGAHCLRARLAPSDTIHTLPWRTPTRIGDVLISLHPAGHILGSAQIKLEPASPRHTFPTTVVTGDHAAPSPHLLDAHGAPPSRGDLMPAAASAAGDGGARAGAEEAFEPVPCDLFVTESTFGLPIFRWRHPAAVADEINVWWRENADAGRTSVLFAYALGKTQRLLTLLDPSIGPIGLHGAALKSTAAYAAAGVALPRSVHANAETAGDLKGRGVVIAPGSTDNTPWLRRFKGAEGLRTAYVSGWMTVRGKRRWRAADQGFALSDHADWPALLRCIADTGAERVAVTHGYAEQLARYLNERTGVSAFTIPTRYTSEDTPAADGAGSTPREPGGTASDTAGPPADHPARHASRRT